jgi:phosphate:Na+ symporter
MESEITLHIPAKGACLKILRNFVLLAVVFGVLGCESDKKPVPDRLSIIKGNDQCVGLSADAPERMAANSLKIKIETAHAKGFFGGKGSRSVVPNQKVMFEIIGRTRGAALHSQSTPGISGDDKSVQKLLVDADGGGSAEVWIKVGDEAGDIVVEVSMPEHPWIENKDKGESSGIKPVRFHITAGISRTTVKADAKSGQTLDRPVAIHLTGPGGAPLAGVPVVWHIEKAPKGTKLVRADIQTDENGQAATQVLMGSGTGPVIISATASDPDRSIGFRPVRFQLFSLSMWEILIVVVGGLALFIMGMKLMTDGLTRVAGAKLRAILQAFTKTTVVGVAVGAGITAVIQSSSATSVMVIGFVNAGLLSLERAIGLIMGANIGTTVTAQMISFNLSSLALPAIAAGVMIQLIAKRKTTQNWGLVLAGFGVLFTGLTTMSGVLKGLQYSDTVTGFFQSIQCAPEVAGGFMPPGKVLLAIGIGTLVTFLVQSSSAAIGLLLALSTANLIDIYTAVPILLGSNIGTTTTAMLAVIGANRGARRTAVAHALFNVLGSGVMFLMFFVHWDGNSVFLQAVDWLTTGDAYAGENLERHIANAHTLFNIACTLLFLPLVPLIAWACRKVVPETSDEKEELPRYLEPHLLDTPALALERASSELIYMTGLSRKAMSESFESFVSGTVPNREKIERREARIDELQHDITDYLVKLSQRDLIEEESRQLPLLMHSVNDAERIGDHAENLVELAERRVERKLSISDDAKGELREMFGEIEAMFRHVILLLEEGDPSAAERALRCEDRINSLNQELARNHTRRLEKGECDLISGVAFLDAVANLEKIGDHLTNIAQAGQKISKTQPEG